MSWPARRPWSACSAQAHAHFTCRLMDASCLTSQCPHKPDESRLLHPKQKLARPSFSRFAVRSYLTLRSTSSGSLTFVLKREMNVLVGITLSSLRAFGTFVATAARHICYRRLFVRPVRICGRPVSLILSAWTAIHLLLRGWLHSLLSYHWLSLTRPLLSSARSPVWEHLLSRSQFGRARRSICEAPAIRGYWQQWAVSRHQLPYVLKSKRRSH